MPTADSDPSPIFGAVFGLTENIDSEPDTTASLRPPRRPCIDAPTDKQALANPAGAAARKKRRERKQRGLPKELLVTEEHIHDFEGVNQLLRTFRDPFAAGSELRKHIEEIPVLAGRLVRTARINTGHMDLRDVGAALSLLGNKVLEQELLQFLEDLTEVKADWEATRR